MRWKFMEDNDRFRTCQACQLDIANFIGMSTGEIRETVSADGGGSALGFTPVPRGQSY
ncbi:hypothetical protein IFO70_25510 [Phormidium tenue FACHB-886]|nr:hypothetical protein [Phormidium tenue FACHB-886]